VHASRRAHARTLKEDTPHTHRSISIVASRKGTFVKDVCPGATYKLSASFGGDERAALMTVSGGTLQEANVAGW
jgi:hypothetical protein